MRAEIPVQIIRYTDDSFPGWVEGVFRDASNHEWHFIEKVPVFTCDNLNADSSYPQPGGIACDILREWIDEDGRKRCLIDTELPWGVYSVDEEKTQFEVFRDDVTSSET